MIKLIKLTLLLTMIIEICLAAELGDLARELYNEYKQKYRKSSNMSPEEEHMRAQIFYESYKYIQAHNSMENRTHDLEINYMSDWTQKEIDSLMGYRKSFDEEKGGEYIPYIDGSELQRLIPNFMDDLPEQMDWRLVEGVVGEVGNQGRCGSCWAFSIVGMLEGQERKLNRTLKRIVPLSQQQLVDCNYEDRGCLGGRFLTALGYIERAGGLQTFIDYPYASAKNECRYDVTKTFPSTRYLNGTKRLKKDDEEFLKRVVAYYGPVSVVVDSNHPEFKQYASGIHYNPNCTTDYTHSVLLVGYGTSSAGQDYWIVRNSWGKTWGMKGYIFMARNRDNNCGIATNSVISLANFPTTEQI